MHQCFILLIYLIKSRIYRLLLYDVFSTFLCSIYAFIAGSSILLSLCITRQNILCSIVADIYAAILWLPYCALLCLLYKLTDVTICL
nr:MAG TPA: hypothetical protein [Caudoviricetes sp.]